MKRKGEIENQEQIDIDKYRHRGRNTVPVEQQFNYIYLRSTCFTVARVRHKIGVLYVEKSTSYLDLKCANTFRE
jgi:hypothetical protein